MIAAAIAALILSTALPAEALFGTSSGRGTTSAQFLRLAPGARAAALGEAHTAAADDASALYWNPAGLVRIEKHAAIFSHASHLGSSFFDYAAYGHNLGAGGAWGTGIQYFSAGPVSQTDISGSNAGTVSPYDLAFSLGYAIPARGYSFGFSGKYIRSKLLTTAQTAAADFGILSPPYFQMLRLAAAVSNVGGTLKFDQDSASLPLVVKVGGAYQATPRSLIALDLGLPRDDSAYVAVGAEYRFPVHDEWSIAGRLGYNSQTLDDISGLSGISMGFGMGIRAMSIDYALLPYGGLGQSHRFSISYKF